MFTTILSPSFFFNQRHLYLLRNIGLDHGRLLTPSFLPWVTEDLLCIWASDICWFILGKSFLSDLKGVITDSSFGIFNHEFLASPLKDSIETQKKESSNFPLTMTSDKVESLNIYNPLFYADIALPKDDFQSWWYKRGDWYCVHIMYTDYEVCHTLMETYHVIYVTS